MIDKDEAIRLLRKEVANKGGDFVYQAVDHQCVYFVDGKPSCLVGHAIADNEFAPTVAQRLNVNGVNVVADNLPSLMDYQAGQVFLAAQRIQDEDKPWSEALNHAEARYRELGGTE